MFVYPPAIDLKVLQLEHPEYTELSPVWEKIDLLASGGYRLERSIAQFLPKRFEEPDPIYKQRIGKFTYRNILGDCLKHQVTRLSNGVVSLSGFSEGSEDALFWQDFRNSTDGGSRSEKRLISELASTLLKFKYAYLQVDRPKSSEAPRNKAEEEALGSPYILLRQPQSVINWGGEDDQLEWAKLRFISVDTSNPFTDELRYIATWVYIDSYSIATYKASVELDKKGAIKNLAAEQGGERPTLVRLDKEPVSHNLGELPIFRVELKNEMWACDQAGSKAYEHLRLDCHKFDLLTSAYFQRFYNRNNAPDGNLPGGRASLMNTYVDEDDQPKVGLEYVPELASFQFAEPAGAIVEHINSTLERVESEVEQLLDLTGASTEPGRVQQQSGYAREFDFIAQRESLKDYGVVIIQSLKRSYKLVQKFRGSSTDIDVTGLDGFESDDLASLLSNMATITSIDFAALQKKLPPILFMLLYEKLCLLLSPSLPSDQIEELKTEARARTFETPTEDLPTG